MEELESGEMKAICTSEGKEYLYRVSDALQVELTPAVFKWLIEPCGKERSSLFLLGRCDSSVRVTCDETAAVLL